MTTVDQPVRSADAQGPDERIKHPLDRLRRAIRTYVGIESFSILVLFLSGCFWIGLLFDYGVFKAFGVDWVQELPDWLRQATRIIVIAVLFYLVARSLVSLVRRFQNNALALVLEQRFPEQLGDLSDFEAPKKAAFDHHGLTWVHLSEPVEDVVKSKQFVVDHPRLHRGRLHGNEDRVVSSAALQRVPTARSFNQDLSHGSGGEALEVQL